ncbi:zincin-like metallopeptidase domain-containing protein [Yersinia enterocolitica]|uniref:ArdC family protein n=1 Tax=Yersinia pseudotuberculosis TaxID=633 RepID=UPI0005E6D678|nr:zincin-like metallopeptidase domain-containing protein [Yersinia pseudotuberculosis]CND61907.1 putative DNA replication primase [Yersinia pseudotuberculosis]
MAKRNSREELTDKPKRNSRQELTDKFIEALESNDDLPWRNQWKNVAMRPYNFKSGKAYRGGNVLNLMFDQSAKDSVDPRWMTFTQASKAGFKIKRGSTASLIEYWKFTEPEEKPEAVKENDGEETPRMFVRYYTLFNGQDIEGLPEMQYVKAAFPPNEMAERLVKATGAKLEHRTITALGSGILEDAAFFSHSNDTIVLPPLGAFHSDSDYYATLLHELCHWTGYEDRLNRRAKNEERDPESPEYAREELRAEIGAYFLTTMLGIDGELQNHAKYTAHYLALLKNDKNEIFKAARDVDSIIEHLFSYDPELLNIIEGNTIAENVMPEEAVQDLGLPNFIPPPEKEQASAPPFSIINFNEWEHGALPVTENEVVTFANPDSEYYGRRFTIGAYGSDYTQAKLIEIDINNCLASHGINEKIEYPVADLALFISLPDGVRFEVLAKEKCADVNLPDSYLKRILESKTELDSYLKDNNENATSVDNVAAFVMREVKRWQSAKPFHDQWRKFEKQFITKLDDKWNIENDVALKILAKVNELKVNVATLCDESSTVAISDKAHFANLKSAWSLMYGTQGNYFDRDRDVLLDQRFAEIIGPFIATPAPVPVFDSVPEQKPEPEPPIADHGAVIPVAVNTDRYSSDDEDDMDFNEDRQSHLQHAPKAAYEADEDVLTPLGNSSSLEP